MTNELQRRELVDPGEPTIVRTPPSSASGASMEVVRASAMGKCFGVRDAIDLALEERFRGRLTVLGDLVHNRQVIERLDAHGVDRASSLDERIETGSVMITAHGTSDRVRDEVRARGYELIDATCPLVEKVHRRARELERDGFHVAVVGKKGHVEVRGLTGDLSEASVVTTEADLEDLRGRARVAFVAQTTETTERFDAMVAAARALLEPDGVEIASIDTTCQPTRDRQAALRELSRSCDLVIVVGDPTSNNSRKLAETARALGVDAHRVGTPADLDPRWFRGRRRCGITAGTSTPDESIDAVEGAIRVIAGAQAGGAIDDAA